MPRFQPSPLPGVGGPVENELPAGMVSIMIARMDL